MPVKVYSNPPPLPEGLSERLLKMIDPKTGCCQFHPQIRLCELVNDETRWVVRRKTCFQCGSRPDGVGGKHHMPGKSIRNPSNYRPERESSRRSRMSSSRSGSSSSSFDS